VGKYAVIGGLAAIHQFIHIGDHADDFWWIFVRKDVPPFTKAAKEPSYVVNKFCWFKKTRFYN
jgi:UDP-N-acetylglucosamine acyltransferase